MNNKHHIKVILDKNATILDFECNLLDTEINTNDFIGKNWFDSFINDVDREKTLEVFSNIFNTQLTKWKTYSNDIRCPDGTHRFIDFNNELVTQNGIPVLQSIGIEHITNLNTQ